MLWLLISLHGLEVLFVELRVVKLRLLHLLSVFSLRVRLLEPFTDGVHGDPGTSSGGASFIVIAVRERKLDVEAVSCRLCNM